MKSYAPSKKGPRHPLPTFQKNLDFQRKTNYQMTNLWKIVMIPCLSLSLYLDF